MFTVCTITHRLHVWLCTKLTMKDPATGELISTCPEFAREDTERAIHSAAAAFHSFSGMVPRERSRLLRKWYDLVIEHAEDLGFLITLESGKALVDARSEVAYAASFLEWFSEEAPRTYGDTIPASMGGNQVITIKEPVGVCGLITPSVLATPATSILVYQLTLNHSWNFPAAMVTR